MAETVGTLGILAGRQWRDPAQRLPVQHVEPLPLGGELAAAVVEVVAELGHLGIEAGNRLVFGGDEGTGLGPVWTGLLSGRA